MEHKLQDCVVWADKLAKLQGLQNNLSHVLYKMIMKAERIFTEC